MFCHATVGKSSIDVDCLSLVPRPEVKIASFSALDFWCCFSMLQAKYKLAILCICLVDMISFSLLISIIIYIKILPPLLPQIQKHT